MRTTLTIDDDVACELRRMGQRAQRSFKDLVNEVLRRGLATGAAPAQKAPRFVVKPKATGFLNGIDPLKLNQLVDELEEARFVAEHRANYKP
jgi:hypothetical protein